MNVSNTIQEVWNLGLTTFSAFVRALKFLAIFLFYLGRIDVQIFAPGIGWFMDSIPLDGLPHCFLRDLLLNEAVSMKSAVGCECMHLKLTRSLFLSASTGTL